MALRTVSCCLLFVLAGCTGLPGGGPGDGTGVPAPDDAPSVTATPSPADVHPGLTAGVDVQAFQAPPVHIAVTQVGTNRTVLNETYRGTFGVDLDGESGPFEPDRSYRVVLRVDGERAWARTVRHFERYDLRVGEHGNVTVESHAVA